MLTPRTTQLTLVASRKRFFKTSLEPKDDLTPVSPAVQLLVRSLKTRKAPGLDGVSNAIKCFPQQLLSLLVDFSCLQNFLQLERGGGNRHERTHSTRFNRRSSARPAPLSSCTPRTNDIPDRRPASNSRYLPTIPLYFINVGIGPPYSTILRLQRAIDELVNGSVSGSKSIPKVGSYTICIASIGVNWLSTGTLP
ncbi:hypothetical protein EVAR_69076_1 [Eumeta japonica]|uniref:Uncharacterized protein n=1 Tax=Eumeta variegata TaxID=151549 RepID=A0A4C1ZD95_EUMVA|nr:hypothetical protein EVAR_69076_1 [Eumeta japonica]